MKKLITLFIILLTLTASAQLSVEIIGNKACRFPYNDNEPIILKITGLEEGQWYEIAFPTNYIESHPKPEITREVAVYFKVSNGFIEINSQASDILSGIASFTYDGSAMNYIFNGPGSVYSNLNTLAQWHQGHPDWKLPPSSNSKQYYLSVRPFNSDKAAIAYFDIIP